MNSGQTIRLGVLTAVHAPLQVLVVLGLSLLLFALYCCSTRRPSSSNPETTNVNPILALLAPSTSHMPKYYVQKNTHDSFKVDLLALVSNVANGIVELRNSDTSLPTLLDGHHKCTLTFNLRWIFLVIKAIILAPLVSYPAVPSSYLTPSTIMLDMLPLSELRSISKYLSRGVVSTIEFSCLPSSISALSRQFFLSAFPFLPLGQLPSFTGVPRATNPLLTTCKFVLTRLAEDNVKLLNLRNVSSEYADAISEKARELIQNSVLRTEFLEQHGKRKWNMIRFALNYEAALLRLGWIEHFVATVEQKE